MLNTNLLEANASNIDTRNTSFNSFGYNKHNLVNNSKRPLLVIIVILKITITVIIMLAETTH
jgi:hypothetical protein